jgi:hypothetical protein
MKVKLILLFGTTIALLLGASANSKDSDSKPPTLSIAMGKHGGIDRKPFDQVKDALGAAGHSIHEVSKPAQLSEQQFDIAILITSAPSNRNKGDRIAVVHNDNKAFSKCISKELGRRVSLDIQIPDNNVNNFLQQGVVSVILKVPPEHFEKYAARYAKGIVEGVKEYIDER